MVTGIPKVMIAGLLALLLFATVTHAAVDVTNFRAVWEGDTVRVTWQTGNQTDHAFFHLWRSEENLQIVDGQLNTENASRVNTSNITSPNACNVSGDSYSVPDRGVPEDAETVYYYLESYNCSDSQSVFKGNGTSGWEIETPIPLASPTSTNSPPTNTPTLTPTPPPSATATATTPPAATTTFTPPPNATATRTATVRPSNTPAPTTTLPPGVSPSPATATSIPSPTQRGAPSATATSAGSAPTVTRAGSAPASTATRAGSAPLASPTLNTRPPGSTPAPAQATATAPPGSTPLPSFESTPEGAPTPIPVAENPEFFPTATVDPFPIAVLPSPVTESQGGELSVSTAAPLPTFPSVLIQPPSTRTAPTSAPVNSEYDEFIRGLIGLILLAAVAVGGYVGWLYIRHQ